MIYKGIEIDETLKIGKGMTIQNLLDENEALRTSLEYAQKQTSLAQRAITEQRKQIDELTRLVEQERRIGMMWFDDFAALGAQIESEMIDLEKCVSDQRNWSLTTFGDGKRVEGLLRHLEKEIGEVRENPSDVYEWIDIVILALDGAWRSGHSPKEVALALVHKQQKNFGRNFPMPASEDDPSEAID